MPSSLKRISQYQITFKAKKQKWHYYLVTDSLANGDEFLIKDKTEEIKFTKFSSSEAQKKDPIFSILNKQFPQSQQYLFKSDSEIDCREAPRKGIELLRKKADNLNVWIEDLANPPNHNGIQIINTLKYL